MSSDLTKQRFFGSPKRYQTSQHKIQLWLQHGDKRAQAYNILEPKLLHQKILCQLGCTCTTFPAPTPKHVSWTIHEAILGKSAAPGRKLLHQWTCAREWRRKRWTLEMWISEEVVIVKEGHLDSSWVILPKPCKRSVNERQSFFLANDC